MTATPSIDLPGWMVEQLSQASPDLLRNMIQTFAEALMSADADAVCGAAYAQRSTERTNTRNGYRRRVGVGLVIDRVQQRLDPTPGILRGSGHHLDQARADILPFTAFPKAAWRQIWSKDGLTTDLAAPTFGSYIPARPDEATYLRLITDFLIGVPYVAKSLLRGQLLPAKWILDFDMRFNYLIPLLEWRAECDHDWSLETGNLGKGLVAHPPADTWRELERTFTGADPKANWEALFEMIALFDRVAREVADLLGYTHPENLVHRVTDHAQRMREGVFAGRPLDAE